MDIQRLVFGHQGIILGIVVLIALSSLILYYVIKVEKMTSHEGFALADSSCKIGYDGTLLPACEGGSDMERLACYEACVNKPVNHTNCKDILKVNDAIMSRYNMYGMKVHGDQWIRTEATPCAEMNAYDY